MAKVRIYQKPAGIPVNTSVFAVEILQNNIWYTRKVSWETLKGLIAGAESLVFANGTLTFTTPDGVSHQVLSVDSEVTPNSANPVSGGAVNTALASKQDTLTFDQVPTDGSTNPVESNGIYDALAGKQDTLTFDTTPTDGSTNPVTSAGIYAAISAITTGIDWKEAVATYADIATTYPNPQDGWTVTTLDDDHTYRYTGTEWVDMFSLITLATASKDGLMSAADFTKLAGIEAQANKTVVSDTLTPSTTTKKVADIKQNNVTTPVYADDADKILRAAFGEHTVTGNPVTFDAFLGLEVVSECKVTMLPIQDTSQGDPSPTNICPISGRDSVTVFHPQESFYNNDNLQAMSNSSAVALSDNSIQVTSTANGTYRSSKQLLSNYSLTEGKRYRISAHYSVNKGTAGIAIRNSSNSRIAYTDYVTGEGDLVLEFALTSEMNYLSFFCTGTSSSAGDVTYTDIKFSEVKEYTHTYSSTVYGGVDDFVSGEGTSEWGHIASYNGETLPSIWLSDRDVYAPNTSPTTGAEVVYKLATPTQITNTPEDITLLKGVNVVSTDGDSLELKYSADIKAYIDSKLNA